MNLTIRQKADELLRVAAIRCDQGDQMPRVLCEIADALIALLAEQRYVDQRDAAAAGFDRFEIFFDSIEHLFDGVRMIDRGAEQRTALQAARELSRQLLHPVDGRCLRHIFAQHVEVFVQDRALVS